MTAQSAREYSGTRTVARKLALQALYRWQLNACPWQDLLQEFGEAEDMPRADREYFPRLIEGVWCSREELDTRLASLADREPRLLDPIEHAILLIGLYELTARPEVPYRVAIKRGGQSGEALWRNRRTQVRECRAGSRRARVAAGGALNGHAHMPLSEFALIDRYFRVCGAQRSDVLAGIGDDAALLAVAPDAELVAATDTLVAGVHFPAGSPPASIGHRALAVNLSDLAAMGARPAWALLALTLRMPTKAGWRSLPPGLARWRVRTRWRWSAETRRADPCA